MGKWRVVCWCPEASGGTGAKQDCSRKGGRDTHNLSRTIGRIWVSSEKTRVINQGILKDKSGKLLNHCHGSVQVGRGDLKKEAKGVRADQQQLHLGTS